MNTPFIKSNSMHIGYIFFSLSLITAYALYYQYNPSAQGQKVHTDLFKRAHTVYLEGMEFYKQGEYDKAIATCEKAIQILPSHAASYNTICLSLMQQGKQDNALTYAQKAVQANPDFAPSYLILGRLELGRNNHDEAKKAFESALKLDDNLFEGHVFLTQLLIQEKTVESVNHANRHATRALELNPTHKDALMGMGNIQFVAGNNDKAKEFYTKVAQIYPDAADARALLAQIDQTTTA